MDPQCYQCHADASVCTYCLTPYGVYNATCVLCNDVNCQICNTNYMQCGRCYIGYGVLLPARASCIPCVTPFCANCVDNANHCYNCESGYGIISSPRSCQLCSFGIPFCQTCNTANIL